MRVKKLFIKGWKFSFYLTNFKSRKEGRIESVTLTLLMNSIRYAEKEIFTSLRIRN
jgi:hypothetical protein